MVDSSVLITRLCMCAPDGALSAFHKEDGRLECHARFMTLPQFLCYKLQQPSVRVIAPHPEGRRAQIVSVFVTGMAVTRTVICDRMIHSDSRCKGGKNHLQIGEDEVQGSCGSEY